MKTEMLITAATILIPSLLAFRAGVLLARARARRSAARDRAEYRAAWERSRRAAFLDGYAQAKQQHAKQPFLPN